MNYTGMKNPQLGRLNGSPWSGHRIRNIPLARAASWQGFQSKSVFLQGWHREPRESAKGFFISPQLDPTIYFNHDLKGNWNYFLFCYEDKAIRGPWLHLPSANPFEDHSDTESLTAVPAFRESCIFLTPLCPVPQSSCKWDKTRMGKKCSPHVLELFRISPLQRVSGKLSDVPEPWSPAWSLRNKSWIFEIIPQLLIIFQLIKNTSG